jgi:hypothetical protein
MKYKEFVEWCNQRACDGNWNEVMAMFCISIMDTIRPLYFWQREKRWRELNSLCKIEELINTCTYTNISKGTPKLIKDWDELKDCKSDTHILEINGYSGWIHPKKDLEFKGWFGHHYLSTHTFYGNNRKESTKLLQSCGFDVELDNWDSEDKKENENG